MQALAKNNTLFMSKTQHYQIQLFSLSIIQQFPSWEEAEEASKVSAVSTDSGVTICALYKGYSCTKQAH